MQVYVTVYTVKPRDLVRFYDAGGKEVEPPGDWETRPAGKSRGPFVPASHVEELTRLAGELVDTIMGGVAQDGVMSDVERVVVDQAETLRAVLDLTAAGIEVRP